MKIIEDKEKYPALFLFGAGSNDLLIREWELKNAVFITENLREMWNIIGSGTAFETEDIFAIQPDIVTGESVDSITALYRSQGLPSRYWVIHRGMGGLTVFDSESRHLLQLSESSYEPSRSYADFDEWYCECLRAEYAKRYSLK